MTALSSGHGAAAVKLPLALRRPCTVTVGGQKLNTGG